MVPMVPMVMIARPGRAVRAAPWVPLCTVLLAASCGGAAAQVRPRPSPPLHVAIAAAKDTNQGGPFYVVVRKIDRAGFLAENYDAIADGLFGEPRDRAVMGKAIVQPGEITALDVARDLAAGELLGVYFLLSAPGDHWRLAIANQCLQRVTIVLGARGIVSVEQR